jgi:hypothetical protein
MRGLGLLPPRNDTADDCAVNHMACPGWLLPTIVALTLVPFYKFHAVKFNANALLTPLWALAEAKGPNISQQPVKVDLATAACF